MLEIEKDGKKTTATKKAFDLFYKQRGFKLVGEKKVVKETKEETKEEIPLEKRTAEELREIAKDKEVKGYYRMSKKELLEELG